MSYRNPSQYVDTQTGQHYRNLVQKLSGVAEDIFERERKKQASISKQLKETEEKNIKIGKEQFEYENKTSGEINKAAANVQSFVTNDVTDSFYNNIDLGGKISTKGILNKDEKLFLKNLDQVSDVMVRDGEARSILLSEDGLKNAGTMGGVSNLNDPNAVKWAQAVTRKGPGKGELIFNYDLLNEGGPETYYSYKDDTMEEPFQVSGSMLNTLAQDPSRSLIVTIPDENANMQQMVESYAYGKDAMGETSKNLNSKYIENQPIKEEPFPGGGIRRYRETNEALLATDMRADVVATIDSLPENQQVALLDFFLSKDQVTADIKYDLNQSLDDDAKNLLASLYVSHAIGKYPMPKQVDVEIIKAEKPTESEIKRRLESVDVSKKSKQIYEDITTNPSSYFKNKKIAGKEILDASIGGTTVGAGGEGLVVSLEYKLGTSTMDGNKFIDTDTITYDLSDPVRLRALIDALGEDDKVVAELKEIFEKQGAPSVDAIYPLIDKKEKNKLP